MRNKVTAVLNSVSHTNKRSFNNRKTNNRDTDTRRPSDQVKEDTAMDTSTMHSRLNDQQITDQFRADVVTLDSLYAEQGQALSGEIASDPKVDIKAFLDKTFPLSNGSHSDAKSYLVYYQQLLVFLNDGTQTGLECPKQFVALCGSKNSPEAILLNNKGMHVELSFDASGEHGRHDSANIEDIQLQGAKYWISLTNIDSKRVLNHDSSAQGYRAKDGSEYLIR